jgi:hypothetical protein
MMVKVIGEKAEEGDRRVVGIIERLASTWRPAWDRALPVTFLVVGPCGLPVDGQESCEKNEAMNSGNCSR